MPAMKNISWSNSQDKIQLRNFKKNDSCSLYVQISN